MIVLAHPRGHVAVTQQAHAAMCGQLGRAWGNERFGEVVPAAEVLLAAEEHELGMVDWDARPALDPASGLPATVTRLDLDTHLPLRSSGPERLAERSVYAALLASVHHTSFYRRPPAYGLLRRPGRRIRAYLDRSAAFQRALRAQVGADEAEVERNWRLVRTWDGLSHDLLHRRPPCSRPRVPAAAGEYVDLLLRPRADGAVTVAPWPFAGERVEASLTGRLLTETFGDEATMQAALADAPEVTLGWELVPAA